MTRLWTFVSTVALLGLLAAPAHALPIANPLWLTGDDMTRVATASGYIDDFIPGASLQLDPNELLNAVTAGSETFTGIAQVPVEVEAEQLIAEVAAFTNMAVIEDLRPNTSSGADASSLSGSRSVEADAVGGSTIQAYAVDEPSSLLMLGCGLVALVFVMKRAKA